MDFLKALFKDGEALTYDQLAEKVTAAKLNVANLADGKYVSRQKYDDQTGALNTQLQELQGRIAQRDTDIAGLRTQLTEAQTDAGKLAGVQTALTDLQAKYDRDGQEWKAKLDKQAYDFVVREKAGELKFSSPAAKRDFVREAGAKGLTLDNGKLLGLDDFVTQYKQDNPGAVIDPKPDPDPEPAGKPKPEIVLPKGPQNPPDPKSAFGFHFAGVRPREEQK